MSLFKEIALLILAAFLLLFILVSFDNSKQSGLFLRSQLQTTAQDTAAVLGIAISNTQSGGDQAALETLFNAVFDSGYYSQIRLVREDGTVIHQKQRELEVHGVPDWFMRAIPLDTAIGSADVVHGWIPSGRLEVTLHPGFAYVNLYQRVKTTLLWFSILFLLVLFFIWFLLHIVLKPLKAMHEQASAIQNNEFILQPKIPRTVELRDVVGAMNRLVVKVKAVFQHQQDTLRRYHDLLYCDEVTGIRNRRFILSELDNVVSESTPFKGCMIIVKVQGLDTLREEEGYVIADSIVKVLANVIVREVKDESRNKYARMSDDEFCLLVKTSSAVAEGITEDIFHKFRRECANQDYSSSISLNAGIVDVHEGDSHGKILSDLDLALAQAQADGVYKHRYALSADLDLPEGKMQWRKWFRQMLDDNRFYLVAQPVFGSNEKCTHKEMFVRANDSQGKLVPAGVFMPMALALGYGLEIDRTVFSLLKKIGEEFSERVPIALNLSTAFFCHADAFEELRLLLKHYRAHNLTLCVEATHSALQQYPERCAEVFSAVKHAGQQFGVDQLDIKLPLQVLQTINPNYVKINAKLLDDISGGTVSAAYQALRSLTGTLDIQIIAVGVDKPDLYHRLMALEIDGVQGNFLGRPEIML